jgi:hypothetical protein
VFYDLMHSTLPARRSDAQKDGAASRWVDEFTGLGQKLRVRIGE